MNHNFITCFLSTMKPSYINMQGEDKSMCWGKYVNYGRRNKVKGENYVS